MYTRNPGICALEQFPIQCRKTQTKAINSANHDRQCNEPIKSIEYGAIACNWHNVRENTG